MNALPMGCADCGQLRRDHDDPGHRWQPPSMDTVHERVAALKTQRATA